MRRVLAVFAMLAFRLFAQESAEQPMPEEEDGILPDGHISRGERDAPAVFARLRDGGVLEVKLGEEWQPATLEGLGEILAKARDEYDLEQRKIGKSGFEDLGHGMKASRFFLSLAAEPTVPWQHVQWIGTVMAEEKLRKLELSDGSRRMLALLPSDCAIEYTEDYKPPPVVKAEVHVVARAEQPAKWGDVEILRPTDVRYKCGDTETTDLVDVTAYLKEKKKAAEELKAKDKTAVFFGQIKAGHKVPFGRILDVMATFEAAGITDVDFYGTAIPPKDIRQMKLLPYPVKNYDAD